MSIATTRVLASRDSLENATLGSPDYRTTTKKLSFGAVDAEAENVVGAPDAKQAAEDDCPLKVFVRVRPPVVGSEAEGGEAVQVVDDCTVQAVPPAVSHPQRAGDGSARFVFDRVFGSDSTQEMLFDTVLRDSLGRLLAGQNVLLFTYGPTNAGKTHTVLGSPSQPGLIPRALEHVMTHAGGHHARVSVSFLEIYNERLYDLLARPASQRGVRAHLQLREEASGHVFVRGLKELRVSSLDEAMRCLQEGSKNRTVAGTNVNKDSSRSHCVFTIKVSRVLASTGAVQSFSQLSIVDLAGSERSHRTGTEGERMREATSINKSLMHLMRCIEIMRWNQQHKSAQRVVPFRDTKLTRMFQEYLNGPASGDVIMVVNVSPRDADYDEAVNAMKYAALSREVKVRPRVPRAVTATAKYDASGHLIRKPSDCADAPATVEVTAAMPLPIAEDAAVSAPPEEEADTGKPAVRAARARGSVAVPRSARASTRVNTRLEDANTQQPAAVAAVAAAAAGDLRRENATLRAALAEIEARCANIERDVREELSQQFAERLREMEAEMTERTMKVTHVERERELTVMTARRRRQVEGRMKNRDAEELAVQVVECEAELDRVRERNAEQVVALQEKISTLERALAATGVQEERAGTQSELQRLAPALAAEKSARMKAESEVQALRTRIASYEQSSLAMSQRVQALEAAVSEARDAAARGMERARAEVQAELEDARAAEEEAEAARAEAEEAQDRVTVQLQAAHEVAEREQAAREETERRLTAALEEGAALKERVTALEARLQTLAAMSDMDAAAQPVPKGKSKAGAAGAPPVNPKAVKASIVGAFDRLHSTHNLHVATQSAAGSKPAVWRGNIGPSLSGQGISVLLDDVQLLDAAAAATTAAVAAAATAAAATAAAADVSRSRKRKSAELRSATAAAAAPACADGAALLRDAMDSPPKRTRAGSSCEGDEDATASPPLVPFSAEGSPQSASAPAASVPIQRAHRRTAIAAVADASQPVLTSAAAVVAASTQAEQSMQRARTFARTILRAGTYRGVRQQDACTAEAAERCYEDDGSDGSAAVASGPMTSPVARRTRSSVRRSNA